ncbi:hypothetical protein [Nonomuraea sp. NPDC049784]|uniref:hypothetical protein n=1 Tax=Nonomuraea sp. NPDC049784 TaxID=3154361 RepID=UPI0033D48A1C
MTVKDILAAIGALSVLAAAAVVILAVISHRADRRRSRGDRDHRATRPAEQVAKCPAQWSDFWRDHDLHKTLRTPKEWKP